MKKEIIILTKSDKRAGYCVAGIDKKTGEWIRVISSNNATEHAVPGADLICDDGKEVDIYDIVEIEFIRVAPTNVQPENYLYNEKVQWKKKGKSNLDEVLRIHDYSFFKITQKDLKEKYSAKAEGWYPTGTDTFVFSLTDKYKDGRYYKVVAQALM